MSTTYTTTVTLDDDTTYATLATTDLTEAIRTWDRATQDLAMRGRRYSGGVAAKALDEFGNVVRDGWILHLFNGHTYLNPNLIDGVAR